MTSAMQNAVTRWRDDVRALLLAEPYLSSRGVHERLNCGRHVALAIRKDMLRAREIAPRPGDRFKDPSVMAVTTWSALEVLRKLRHAADCGDPDCTRCAHILEAIDTTSIVIVGGSPNRFAAAAEDGATT